MIERTRIESPAPGLFDAASGVPSSHAGRETSLITQSPLSSRIGSCSSSSRSRTSLTMSVCSRTCPEARIKVPVQLGELGFREVTAQVHGNHDCVNVCDGGNAGNGTDIHRVRRRL
ncbi:hypothetical protein [[Actinomadura] parvosata]|uniref:hypothetical protein n=1 Tax=[Actinomadura] parvosata TaxID=1955412 RepID=UPI001648FADE